MGSIRELLIRYNRVRSDRPRAPCRSPLLDQLRQAAHLLNRDAKDECGCSAASFQAPREWRGRSGELLGSLTTIRRTPSNGRSELTPFSAPRPAGPHPCPRPLPPPHSLALRLRVHLQPSRPPVPVPSNLRHLSDSVNLSHRPPPDPRLRHRHRVRKRPRPGGPPASAGAARAAYHVPNGTAGEGEGEGVLARGECGGGGGKVGGRN